MKPKRQLLRRFLSYYRPHWELFTIDMLCALFIAAADLMFRVISRRILKEAVPGGNLRFVVVFAGVLVVLYLITSVLHYIINYWGHVLGVRMEYDMRKDLFAHLQTLSFNFYDNNRTGHLMSRMINDLNQVAELAHHGPEDIFISLVMLFGSFFILLGVQWRLAVIVYLSVPFLFWFTIVKRRSMANAFKDVRVKIADVNADLENSISGIRVVQSFTSEEHEMDKFNRGNEKFKNSRIRALKKMAEFATGVNFLSGILNTAVIGFGSTSYTPGSWTWPILRRSCFI